MKRRLRNASKLPEPTIGTIRVGDLVTAGGSSTVHIVIGEAGRRELHCQSLADAVISTYNRAFLSQVTHSGRVLTYRDIEA
jgi:D-serine deaminase-like pyridoxal phosphate-dependent protein